MRQVDQPQDHRHLRQCGKVLKGTALQDEMRVCVIEGDPAAIDDPERIRATGCAVIPVDTGTGCHLEPGTPAWCVQQLDL